MAMGWYIIKLMKKQPNADYDYYVVPKIRNLKELTELRRNSKKTAIMWRENGKLVRRSFDDVFNDARDLSKYFGQYYKGKNIAVVGENSYAWMLCALAIAMSGNVCVALDKDADEETWRRQLKQADAAAVYYSENYCENISRLMRKSFPLEEWENYRKEGRRCAALKKAIDAEADAMIFFTSGTTGYSKAVVLSQKNIVSDLWAAASIYTPAGSAASFLPYHHAFGFVTSLLMPYYYGCQVFISGSLKHLTDDFKDGKPDTIFAVPMVVETFYKQIWRQARREGRERTLKWALRISEATLKIGVDMRAKLFKSILAEFGGNCQHIICGGAYLDVKYVKWFRAIGVEVLNGYGITECSPVVAVNRNNYRRDGSVGQLCRETEVRIVNGEITVKGEMVMKGYYRDKRATKEVLRNGWLYTGDLGRMDEDGFLFITGRKKNLIILSNGENVSPEEIEGVLLRDRGVTEVVVYEANNRIVAAIYPSEGYLGDQDYFDALIGEYNKDKPKNRQIALAELRSQALPRNNNGKILRNKIIEESQNEG